MYIPKNMKMNGEEAASEFISHNNFGLLLSSDLNATHLPFVFKSNEGKMGVLYGHIARANDHWKVIENKRVLIVFSGPHSYISPTWYHHKPAVPTWNYTAVHCYGTVQLLGSHESEKVMQDIIAKHEPSLLLDKDFMPDDSIQEKLRQAIVAFKIIVDDIQAKEKLGQNRKMEDQQGVYSALEESKSLDSNALAKYMRNRKIGVGG